MTFDEYEFEPIDSEQALEIAISSPKQHRDLKSFLTDCGAFAVDGPPPPADWPHWGEIVDTLRRLAEIELPPLTSCRQVALILDDWNDRELAVSTGSVLVWYHWSTTA
jgi:hypothetical protein